MIIKTLNVTIYNQHGSAWWTELTPDPQWADIEAAITRLDQYCYPFVWLHRSDTVEEDSAYDFDIIGGNGLYAMDGVVDAKGFTYIEPDGGDDIISVWRSDQGFETEAKYVCRDLTIVLRAVKYFCEHGTPEPTLNWEWRDLPL
jgi:hypothetical protein